MSLALPAPQHVIPKVVAHPKQTKLLGAKYEGVGVITAVAVELPECFCLITDAAGFEHHAFVSDLLKAKTTFPAEAQPYRTVKRRVGYGLFNEMHELESVHHSDLTHVDDLEAAIRLPLPFGWVRLRPSV